MSPVLDEAIDELARACDRFRVPDTFAMPNQDIPDFEEPRLDINPAVDSEIPIRFGPLFSGDEAPSTATANGIRSPIGHEPADDDQSEQPKTGFALALSWVRDKASGWF